MSVKVFKFGCLPPKNIELIDEVLSNAHIYYNNLVDLENKYRDIFINLRIKYFPEIKDFEKSLDELKEKLAEKSSELKKLNSTDRSRKNNSEKFIIKTEIIFIKNEIKKISEKLKEVKNNFKLQLSEPEKEFKKRCGNTIGNAGPNSSIRKTAPELIFKDMCNELWPDFWMENKLNEINKNKELKLLRSNSNLNDGTYNLIEEDVVRAAKSNKGKIYYRNKSRFEGLVGVQLKDNSVTTKNIFSNENSFIQIDSLPLGFKQFETRSGRRHAKTNVRIRLKSDGKKPVFCELPVIIHRELPNGIIKKAWIKSRKIGLRRIFEFQLVIDSSSFENKQKGGVLAIDIGWRKIGDKYRVGYWCDDKYNHGEFSIPESLINEFKYINGCGAKECSCGLKSTSDKHFNTAKLVLVEWLKNNEPPDFIKEQIKYIDKWKSSKKLAKITVEWINYLECRSMLKSAMDNHGVEFFDTFESAMQWQKQKQLNNIPTIVIYLEAWRRKNRHLYGWISNQREKLLLKRNEIYRIFASKSSNYEHLILEDFDLNKIAKNKDIENAIDSTSLEKTAHRIRSYIAPSKLKEAFENKYKPEKIDPSGTTSIHFKCGYNNKWTDDEKKELMLKCQKCGEIFDRDYNAARNLVNKFLEASGQAVTKLSEPLENQQLAAVNC